MKYKTTKKDVINGYCNVISVNYCLLQNLLYCESATAYTTRREGWAADVYDFGNTAIVTGYAPFGNIYPEWELCRKYDKAAEKIRDNYELSWNEQSTSLRALIADFVEEAQNENYLH